LAILPVLLTVYCLQSLDKTSLAYASVFGLIDHAHLVGDEYSWLGAIVYVAQLVWQPVVAYFLVKFPIGKFCATMVFCWGATLCGMAAARDFGGLMAARFILGSFEASVAPTFIAIVQMWYRRSEQTNRNVRGCRFMELPHSSADFLEGGMVFNAGYRQHRKCSRDI
jgi:MFS family permease